MFITLLTAVRQWSQFWTKFHIFRHISTSDTLWYPPICAFLFYHQNFLCISFRNWACYVFHLSQHPYCVRPLIKNASYETANPLKSWSTPSQYWVYVLLCALGTDCTGVLVGVEMFWWWAGTIICVIFLSVVELRNGVFQASPPTQLFGETERDGAPGTRGIPTHYARAAHESEAVYQGIYWFFVHLRLVYCCPNCNNRTHVPNSLKIRVSYTTRVWCQLVHYGSTDWLGRAFDSSARAVHSAQYKGTRPCSWGVFVQPLLQWKNNK